MSEQEKKGEPKTLFEHLGLMLNKGGEPNKIVSKYKNIAKFFFFLVLTGLILGTILDAITKSSIYTTVIPLCMCLLFLIKWYKDSEKNEEKKN